MARSKHQEYLQLEEVEDKSSADGLDIISIGSLYNGPWDKKYWSSTRGKDRYPYPVGYEARRAYNGRTYKMEINEGPKGPVFVITSTDGYSCCGQTPDIVWERFQKQFCSRVRVWQGKRFSCKIDGIQFFGFKNPLVQRLLRELVANINGLAEQRMGSSCFSTEDSITEGGNGCPVPHTNPDLRSMARPEVTGKRSEGHESVNTKFKRPRPGYPPENNKQRYSSSPFALTSHGNNGFSGMPSALPAAVRLKDVTGEQYNNNLFTKDGFPLSSVDDCDFPVEKTVPAHEQSELASSENGKLANVFGNWSAEGKPLDRSRDRKVEGLSFPMPMEDAAGDVPASKYSKGICIGDLCPPDNIDSVQDSASNTCDKSTGIVKEDLIVTDVAILEGCITESHIEEIGTCDSNTSSGKSDFDSAGQEIAKSMMTLLLPQAIPLLKKNSSKKKETISVSKDFPSTPKIHKENDENGYALDAEFADMDHSVVPSSEQTKYIIPDTFDDGQYGDNTTNRPLLPSENAGAIQASVDKVVCPSENGEQFVNVDAKKLFGCHDETVGSKDIFCLDEMQLSLSKKPQSDRHLFDSVSTCAAKREKILSHETQNVWKNLDGNSLPEGKDLEYAPDCNEALTGSNANLRGTGSSTQLSMKDSSIQAAGSETSYVLATQVPKKVYTRKKLRDAESTIKYNAPLSESIRCRILEDGNGPETTGTLIDSVPYKPSSSANKPCESNCLGAGSNDGRELLCLHMEQTATSPNPLLESLPPFVSQTQTLIRDNSKRFTPSVSHCEKPQAHIEGSLVGCKNNLEVNDPVSSQQQGTEFCFNNIPSSTTVLDDLDLNLHRNLELTNELKDMVQLVGCYFHPMPVLSLMLTTKGNEVYICALCGIVVDKDRTLFLYKIAIDGTTVGRPSFVGHTTMTLPSPSDIFGKMIALEGSGLQLTPDGHCLVLLGSIKTPHCREGRLGCSCSVCTLHDIEYSTVNLVQVKAGYVSVLVQLRTDDSVQCILVCEPNHLVAAEESGRLHLWTMNSTWSAPIEEFVISANDYMRPYIVELKRVPQCASLIVGHDGLREFTVWDISKRIFISRFSAPGTSVYQFFPISLFCWPREVNGFNYSNVEEDINQIMDATKLQFSEHRDNHSFPPLAGDDIAMWLLVFTASNSDTQSGYMSSACPKNPDGWWRLALLVKNKLILGSVLDPRATSINASSGRGIIGTFDGFVYIWELSTGTKLGTLHHFKGESVSCIATGDATSSILAVAGETGQLLVYLPSK